ncbi:3-hydroxyacyl-CoA dehydrogenase/enoyl-CoA hydratase family protein [Lyngbya confervoides]|uniref:3-hydroxyacyl-CoA dehydrogenase NAD-binding domain-containing protein n=1 Tax=Lyngbya confervoides BDU141951 TaxID=1574623 RepID=A0ABD4T640_9CYAN|nr:3-hydroxyacyl-CoA dehydrogenase/enoyl-CoA hydratase family protein [Lyngbya confervoides]MCM1984052.1 3-hydroxyacyl-CoA dehydrogenase NAD-binding domain-containing protein [Lyngbya confervoides BDU141951]
MHQPFQTAAVLGAGVMGSQIAAHLANLGLAVDLLDLASSDGPQNSLVEGAFRKALQLSPPIFYSPKLRSRVRLGNYTQHFDRLREADWIIEAVVENLEIKQDLMARIEAVARPDAVISSNTSGLPIQAIAQGRSLAFRQRFLGTHFFNPPRYLKLLELIPGPDTDPQILDRMQFFAERSMGKGVVIAKDTPNFIANRIGMYVILQGIQTLAQQDYAFSEIETLTGPLVGRPKSATFRTADLVGLDTIAYVAKHLYQAIPEDEQRDQFKIPSMLVKLIETGSFGAKTGQGFYKKVKREILALNPQTFAYETQTPPNLPGLKDLLTIEDLSERLRAMYADPGRIGKFFRTSMLKIFSYCAHRIPDITDSPAAIDRAMRWGFGWELGPFEIWDVLGFQRVVQAMQQDQLDVPAWILAMAERQVAGFYSPVQMTEAGPVQRVQTPRQSLTLEPPQDVIDLKQVKADPERVIWHNSESALLDLGDGVVLFEFRSKGNTLSLKVLEGFETAMDLLGDHPYLGMVVGNESPHFSGGANLVEMGTMAQEGNVEAIQQLIVSFQDLLQRMHEFPKPIVAAVQGRALGGGCEFVMACPHVVAAAESYLGLVELSVGLIPGAGGITRLVSEVTQRAASESPSHIQPFLVQAFETIAMAKVSNSAYEAQDWGYLKPTDQILRTGDRRLAVAKETVQRLAQGGYMPPPKRAMVTVLGQPGRALLEMAAMQMLEGHYISEYDCFLAGQLAYVMTGGDLTAAASVPQSYLLQLERHRFIPLLRQPKTHARMDHLLKTKKPLRN